MTTATRSTDSTGRSVSRAWSAATWSLIGLYVTAGGIATWLAARAHARHPSAPEGAAVTLDPVLMAFMAIFASFAVVGAIIVARRPRQALGWLMLATAVVLVAGLVANGYALLVLSAQPAAPSSWALLAASVSEATIPLAFALGFVFLPLFFPDGRLPSRRWRPVAWVAGVLALTVGVEGALRDELTGSVHVLGQGTVRIFEVANPLAARVDPVWSGGGFLVMWALMVVAATASVVRFRRSVGVERQQMKWFALAAGVVLAGLLAVAVPALALDRTQSATGRIVQVGMFCGYPLAVGVAVLRYRLYEIDRLISRTVTYGLVVAVLGTVYAGVVVSLSAALSALTGREGSDLIVAASVLVVIALFGPVRSRVQAAVDRRFNRSGYDARRAVDTFAAKLRDDVDLEETRRGVVTTAAAVVQPATTSLWLAGPEDGR